MAFCGQCGLLLNTNITKCPRCGTTTDFNDATPGAPAADNAATIIAHTNNLPSGNAPSMPYTPPPSNATPYYPTSGGNAPQSNNNYVIPGAFQQGVPQSGGNYMIPNPQTYQSNNQVPGMYPPGVFPGTDPGYSSQPPPPRKVRKWPIILVIVLVVALVAVTVMFFALGSNPLASLFGPKSTPTVQTTPIAPTTGATPQTTATPQITATPTPSQQAQATVQQYYTDINAHNYQDAYYLWVNNPDNYNHYVQGFAHTQRDDITLGDAIPQTDGTVQVNLTVQATEDATGGGTQVSTYRGYYTVGQQADGSWKIIYGHLG